VLDKILAKYFIIYRRKMDLIILVKKKMSVGKIWYPTYFSRGEIVSRGILFLEESGPAPNSLC